MKRLTQWTPLLFLLVIGLLLISCGGGKNQLAGFSLDLPEDLNRIDLNSLRVSGSVWEVDENGNQLGEVVLERDAARTIRGNYALSVGSLSNGESYEFRLNIFYHAADYYGGNGTVATQALPVEVNADVGLCPNMALAPDQSLVDGQWLLLCSVAVQAEFQASQLIQVVQSEIECELFDADGDAMSNLRELGLDIDPYDGDADGDCVADQLDAFPKDTNESLDTDADGIGNKADADRDGDGLSNTIEASKGTDPLRPDTDADFVADGLDNCPLNGMNASQADQDQDGIGNLCDTDSDNDGLSDADELVRGTLPLNPDTDADGLSDGREIALHTNPLSTDTDTDGHADGSDLFPTDTTEHADADGDGVGDNGDRCPQTADAGNADTDIDGTGDACDADDDGDNVMDTIEAEIGSNPLSADSDGDGLNDWFGGAQSAQEDRCLLDARTGGNMGAHDADSDADGFGALCDCDEGNAGVNPSINDAPDFAGLDSDCDGIDGDSDDALFVSGSTGNDSNAGTADAPLASLSAAGLLAQSAGKDVYAAQGDYALVSTFVMPSGVQFFGGYSADFLTRDRDSNPTNLFGAITPLIQSEEGAAGTGLDGFILTGSSGGTDAVGVEILGGSFALGNTVLNLGDAAHLTGIRALEADITLANNRLFLSDLNPAPTPANTARAIYLDGSQGTIADNEIRISDYAIERVAIYCSAAGLTDVVLSGTNRLDVLEGSEIAASGRDYIVDCTGSTRYHSVDTVIPGNLAGFDMLGLPIVNTLF